MFKKRISRENLLGNIKLKLLFFKRIKALPDQAGFIRRFLAFAFDSMIISLIASGVHFWLSELATVLGGVHKWSPLLRDIIIAYIYFALFFRFGGRTPGKRLFRLKVVDLKGRSRLGWYQSFERAHGYVASALMGSLGFIQVLWDKEGLTMHDKIASTTVVRLPKKKKVKPKSGQKH